MAIDHGVRVLNLKKILNKDVMVFSVDGEYRCILNKGTEVRVETLDDFNVLKVNVWSNASKYVYVHDLNDRMPGGVVLRANVLDRENPILTIRHSLIRGMNKCL